MGISARALRAGKAVIEVGLLIKPVAQQLRALQMRVQRVGQSLTSAGTFGVAGGGFAGLRNLFLGTSAAALAAWPIKLAANLELATAQLGTFTSSEKVARDILLELQKFSGVSMVPFQELSEAAAMMIRFGVAEEQVAVHTKALASIAGGSADEFQKLLLAFSQIASAGKLQGEEMRQLKNTAFNPIREIAEITGETMDEVRLRMEAGTVSFQEVANALQRATGPAGRFAGLLGRINETLRGQFAKAVAQVKLAVLPPGETALPILTKWLKAVNGIIPAMASWIRTNAAVVRTLLYVAVGVASVAVAFTTLGLGMLVLAKAAGGILTALSAIAGVLAASISPIGLATAALAGLAAWFVRATETGQAMAATLAGWFGNLATIARQTFQAISDSIAAGDLEMAAKVAISGLKVAWQEGTHSLEEMWLNFKDVAVRTVIEMIFDIQKHWQNLVTSLQSMWNTMVTGSKSIGEQVGHWLTRSDDPALAADQDRAHNQALANIEAEGAAKKAQIESDRQAELAAIEEARRQAQEFQSGAHNEALDAAKKERDDARREFDRRRDAAARAAEAAKGDATDDFGLGKQFSGLGLAMAAAKDATSARATFDTRLVKQMFGGTQDQQLTQLKKIERNTRGGGGLPVV